MRKILIGVIAVIILALIVGAMLIFNEDIFNSNQGEWCKITETRETSVPLQLAKAVGEDYVSKYYPEFSWVYVGDYLVENSFGDANYYILIFRKSEFTTLNTLEKLEQNAKLFSDSSSDESDKKYQFNNIATVMTSAMKEDKLIQRHYRGIPEVIGKKLEIKDFVEDKYSGKTIGSLITDFPMGVFYYEIVDKNSKEFSGNVISVYDNSIISRSDLVKNQNNIQERKEQRYSTYESDECERYQGAISEAEKAHIDEWNGYE